jgi:AraC-like DNA-binding protein
MIFEDTGKSFHDKNFPYGSRWFNNTFPSQRYTNHCHKALEIIYVTNGVITLSVEQSTFPMKQNEIYIIPSYSNHAVFNTWQGEWLAVLFDMDIIGRVNVPENSVSPGTHIFNQVYTHSTYWPPNICDEIISLIKKMHREYTKKTLHWQLAIKSLATQFLLTALRNFPKREAENIENNKQIWNLKAAIEYIGMNYKNNICLAKCAAKIGYNSSYFSRFFRLNMGISFKKYVNSVKIEQAKWLLLTTQMPIIDVCYESGFSDVGTFNRIFKILSHKSPSEFKKLHGKKPEALPI